LEVSEVVADAFTAHQSMVENETLAVKSSMQIASGDEVIHVVATDRR
jgi:hypothetical protein